VFYLLAFGPHVDNLRLSRKSLLFMEPEVSLPYSQKPASGPCPEADERFPRPHIYLSSTLILSSNLHLYLISGLYPSSFPTKALYELFFSPILATHPSHQP